MSVGGGAFKLCLMVALVLAAAPASVALGDDREALEPDLRELRRIGTRLVKAVKRRDTETILRHVQPHSRKRDKQALQDPASHLYCYIFDSRCKKGPGSSVYDFFAGTKPLGIRVNDLGESAVTGARYAVILYYPFRTLDAKRLNDPTYVCEHEKLIVSWTFRSTKEGWISDGSPFDDERERFCGDPEVRLHPLELPDSETGGLAHAFRKHTLGLPRPCRSRLWSDRAGEIQSGPEGTGARTFPSNDIFVNSDGPGISPQPGSTYFGDLRVGGWPRVPRWGPSSCSTSLVTY